MPDSHIIPEWYKRHIEEEKASRAIYRDEMLNAVENKIKVVVNGKIDNLAISVKDVNSMVKGVKDDLKKHVDVVQPIIEQFNNRKGFWNTLSASSKNISVIAAAIIGIGVILTFVLNNLPTK